MTTIQLYFYSINERHSRGINYNGLHATNKNTNTYGSLVVTKTSSLGTPDSLTAFPTAPSVPQSWAVSRCLYPVFNADITQGRADSCSSSVRPDQHPRPFFKERDKERGMYGQGICRRGVCRRGTCRRGKGTRKRMRERGRRENKSKLYYLSLVQTLSSLRCY